MDCDARVSFERNLSEFQSFDAQHNQKFDLCDIPYTFIPQVFTS